MKTETKILNAKGTIIGKQFDQMMFVQTVFGTFAVCVSADQPPEVITMTTERPKITEIEGTRLR